jgi:hypothetical protein
MYTYVEYVVVIWAHGLGREVAVEAVGANGDDPGRDVGDGAWSWPGVASRADADDALVDGVEGGDSDGVGEEGVERGVASQRGREHVHPVRHRFVHRRQDVRVVAPAPRPAHLVGRDVGVRRSSLGCPVRLPQRIRTCIESKPFKPQQTRTLQQQTPRNETFSCLTCNKVSCRSGRCVRAMSVDVTS